MATVHSPFWLMESQSLLHFFLAFSILIVLVFIGPLGWALLIFHEHVGTKPPPKCFVSFWVFHIILHCLKSIDSFYTKLGRWAGDLLTIIFTWKMSVNVKVVTSQWWRHVFCHFWSFQYAYFLQCVRKSTSRGIETWKNFVHITKIKWDMAFLIMKNNSAKYGVPPWQKSPNWSRNFVPANAAMLHMCCARWLKHK